MLYKAQSAYFIGIDAFSVDVEVNVLERSMPGFDIVGLASREVAESRERVKNALVNTFKEFPYNKRILVNLAPADVPKEGSYYDLPIAACLISEIKNIEFPPNSAFFGELSLDGKVRQLKGAYLLVSFAMEKSINNVFLPASCYEEVKTIKDVNVYPISSITDLLDFESARKKFLHNLRSAGVEGVKEMPVGENDSNKGQNIQSYKEEDLVEEIDFNDVSGQEIAKRALEITACGGHNILLEGSPGTGKTMLARALRGILPSLTETERHEVAKIYSACGLFNERIFTSNFRPFRSPHHTISYSGMVGGGVIPKPGEISLAHKGILFLDEFSEFKTDILECLRQPMEDGTITLSRIKGSVTIPCDFTLVACTNPCPCGFYGDPKVRCVCKPWQVLQYQKKISGPIMDRVDMRIRVSSPSLQDKNLGVGEFLKVRERVSPQIKTRVEMVRDIQSRRYKNLNIKLNSRMNSQHVKEFCQLDFSGQKLLDAAIEKFHLSPRSVVKILKVSRTIADMEESPKIKANHLAEAIQYKTMGT